MTTPKETPSLNALPLKQDYSEADMQARLELLRDAYDQNDGKPETELSVSASKFKAFESCPRIWYQGNVLKAYTENQAQASGKRIHAQIEDHYKHGQVVAGPAATVMRFYPLRKQSPGVSGDIAFTLEAPFKSTWAGATINGVVDLIAKPGTAWPSGVIPNGGLYRILDLKTSSNIDEYCLKQSQLLSDRQLAIYAKHLMDTLNISTVEISQVQVNRKAPYSGRMLQPELMTLGRARGIEVDDVSKVNIMRSLRNALPDVKTIPIPDWEAQGQKRPCDSHYGKQCPYYAVCHGRQTFAQMAANSKERVESESNLLAQLVAPAVSVQTTPAQTIKQEHSIMSGITSPQASNATILYPEEGSWTVENGVAIWKGKLNGHNIVFRSKGKKAKISLDGGAEEVLPDAADFMPNSATGHGNVDDLRKHFLYPALERLRQSYGMLSMFGAPATQAPASTTTQAQPSQEDDAVLAALTAEAHAGEEAGQTQTPVSPSNAGSQTDTSMLVAELQSIYNTVPAETLAQWVAAGLTLHYMTTAPKEEVLARMSEQPKCGPTRAATRLEKVAHLRKDATVSAQTRTATQAETVKPALLPEVKTEPLPEIAKTEVKAEMVKSEPDTLDLTLYIRCLPMNQQYIAFELLIDPILTRVAELGGKKHWMQIAAFDVQKHLITALDEQPQTWLAEKASGRPVVVTNTDSALWRALSHVLITTAKEVVIGL